MGRAGGQVRIGVIGVAGNPPQFVGVGCEIARAGIVIVVDGSADSATGASRTCGISANPGPADHGGSIRRRVALRIRDLDAGIDGEIRSSAAYAGHIDADWPGTRAWRNYGGDLRVAPGADCRGRAIELNGAGAVRRTKAAAGNNYRSAHGTNRRRKAGNRGSAFNSERRRIAGCVELANGDGATGRVGRNGSGDAGVAPGDGLHLYAVEVDEADVSDG